MRAAILTISSSRAQGKAHDASGVRLAALAERLGAELAAREIVPDEQEAIERRLRHWSHGGTCELILTTGGTGFAADDVTPEATRAVIEREAPGLAEAMRLASKPHTEHWMLSRGLAGIAGRALIVNFPGSPRSIDQVGEAIAGPLAHGLALLAGVPTSHQAGR